jgi:hypothetical protein
LILTSTMLAAFIFLALVTVAFAEVVGWVILGFVCFYWIVYFIIWLLQLLGSNCGLSRWTSMNRRPALSDN